MEHTGVLIMDINEQAMLDLIKGQAAIAQAVSDMNGRLDRTFVQLIRADVELSSRMDQKDKEIATQINDVKQRFEAVDRKLWYFTGAVATVSFILGTIREWILNGFHVALGGK